MKRIIQKSIFLALAMSIAVPVSAQTFRAPNGMKVRAAGPDRFIISGFPYNTPQSHWCAAATYAFRFLNARQNQRMYIVGNSGRSQREFLISLSPKGTASETTRSKEFSVRLDGANRRVDEGLDFCRERFFLRG